MKLAKITVDGIDYLGKIKDNTITGIASGSFESYLKAKARGEFLTVTVGDNKNLVVTELTDVQVLEYKRVKSLWKYAVQQTDAEVTCGIFDRLLRKK